MLRNCLDQEDCILRIVYVDIECRDYSLLEAALTASSALLLSYNIRRWVCLELYIKYCPLPSIEKILHITINGSSAKGLSPSESQLVGFIKHIINKGYWPGVSIGESSMESIYRSISPDCVSVLEFLETAKCTSCIHIDRRELPNVAPWWITSSVLVLHDERCIKRC